MPTLIATATVSKKKLYENLRPKVANLPEASLMGKYDTIFVGSPIWWHQPAMVICTFLEAFDLKGKNAHSLLYL